MSYHVVIASFDTRLGPEMLPDDIRLDFDGDGQRTSALAYAQRLLTTCSNRPRDVAAALAAHDEAVAVRAAALLKAGGANFDDAEFRLAVKKAGRTSSVACALS
jgi:hypothetical protein